jgi:hypothetical protein
MWVWNEIVLLSLPAETFRLSQSVRNIHNHWLCTRQNCRVVCVEHPHTSMKALCDLSLISRIIVIGQPPTMKLIPETATRQLVPHNQKLARKHKHSCIFEKSSWHNSMMEAGTQTSKNREKWLSIPSSWPCIALLHLQSQNSITSYSRWRRARIEPSDRVSTRPTVSQNSKCQVPAERWKVQGFPKADQPRGNQPKKGYQHQRSSYLLTRQTTRRRAGL